MKTLAQLAPLPAAGGPRNVAALIVGLLALFAAVYVSTRRQQTSPPP